MSFYAVCYSVKEGLGARHLAKRHRLSFQAPLINFLRPNGYWPQPFSIEQAFTTMQWFAATGEGYTTSQRWGWCGVKELLSAGSGLSASIVEPIRSLDDLRKRFHYAILGVPQSDSQIAWRQAFNIDVGAIVTVPGRTYKPFCVIPHLGFRCEADIQKTLETMLHGSTGTRMKISLNSVHPSLTWLHHCEVIVGPSGFCFSLEYGENPKDNPHASYWNATLARTRAKESFLDTFARARDVFQCLVHGERPIDLNDFWDDKTDFGGHVKKQIDKIPVDFVD